MTEDHKKEKVNYECEHCYKEFKTSEECNEHELHCPKKPVRIRGNIKTRFGVWEGFKFGIGFGLGILIIGILVFIIKMYIGISILNSVFG